MKSMAPMVAVAALIGCSVINSKEKDVNPPLSQEFKDYWYAGKAELTRYKLEQARYGEIHQGDAVLIFVTEDFLTDQQVKYEGHGPDDHAASVMKLNFTRKFLTGIYPYSIMSSIFSPVDHTEPTLKVTTSSQEWCGHTFAQLNLRNNRYEVRHYSYFQNEGDREFNLEQALLEDELWTRIRLNPSDLPTGDIELIPGTQFLRLGHREFAVEKASADLEVVADPALSEKPLTRYRIEYQEFQRELEITFEQDFPYAIVAWEEKVQSGFGEPRTLTTRAVRTHVINTPYWTQHAVADTVLRQELGL